MIQGLFTLLILQVEAAPTTAPSQPPPPKQSISSLSPGTMARQLAGIRERDPLGFLAMDLGDVTDLLNQLNTRDPTQPRQAQVVARLDELIEMLQRQGNGTGTGANPTKPRADSVIAKGKGGEGPMHDPKTGTRTWGELPPKQREQILQSTSEGFPPGYESILSSYYKRLAQENVESSVAPASPSTQPASK
jgi:hypothetical protein